MRKVNLLFAFFLGIALLAWAVLADYGGYTSRNATITARSISVFSTMDGKVAQMSANVGTRVSAGLPLVTIQNDRIDRSRLTELLGQRDFLWSEIVTTEARAAELGMKKEKFSGKASAYLAWMKKDLGIQRTEALHELRATEERYVAKTTEVEQTARLLQDSQVSAALVEQAKSDAAVKQNEVQALQAKLARVDLRLAAIKTSGVLQDNGNASYWDRVRDDLEMRLLENRQEIGTMKAKLAQLENQILVEEAQVGEAFIEEHRAPFDGVINAVLTSEGERVIAGTNLVEVLDCTNPIAIVSAPDHRFGDFFIGQRATIKPLDSDERIEGTVQHISSSALISRDTSIATSPEARVGGNRIIVAFRNGEHDLSSSKSCDTARRAVVTIETEKTFISEMISDMADRTRTFFNDVAWNDLPTWIAALGTDQ